MSAILQDEPTTTTFISKGNFCEDFDVNRNSKSELSETDARPISTQNEDEQEESTPPIPTPMETVPPKLEPTDLKEPETSLTNEGTLEAPTLKETDSKPKKKEKLPMKKKLKIYIRFQFWIDLLLSVAVSSAYYGYQTWPDPLYYIPGYTPPPKPRPPALPSGSNYLIPSSSYDLLLLANQERICYRALQKCQYRAVNPSPMENYSYTGDNFLATVNQYLTDYETSSGLLYNRNFAQGPDLITGNPIASFRMIDRFVSLLQLLLVNEYPCEEFSNFTRQFLKSIRWPNGHDSDENILRILRLQFIYDLKTEHVAKGILANFATGIDISAWQMYRFGLVALKHRYYYLSIQWLDLALRNKRGGMIKDTSFYDQVITTLSLAVAEHDSTWNGTLATDTKYHFSEKLVKKSELLQLETTFDYNKAVPNRNHLDYVYRNTKDSDDYSFDVNYWATCSGEDLRPIEYISKLFCWLESKNHPTWTIRPLKMEFLSIQPDIVRVHDILGDKLIEQVIKESQADMDISRVVDKVDPKLTHVSHVRTSRQAWVADWFHPNLSYFSKTAERVTGLVVASPDASEKLQVLSYSFGGHYEPHVDALKKNATYGPTGDRILTFMYYLSDVQAGGYTSFTNVGIGAKPIKGSAVFWFNLFQNGYTDEPISQHGGCPVILGRKFAANKWVRLHAQFKEWKCNTKTEKALWQARVNGKRGV